MHNSEPLGGPRGRSQFPHWPVPGEKTEGRKPGSIFPTKEQRPKQTSAVPIFSTFLRVRGQNPFDR